MMLTDKTMRLRFDQLHYESVETLTNALIWVI